jgi:DNA-binding HxlR family transcriptional regulator
MTPQADTVDLSEIERRSSCPVACTLDVIGDRWTLLLVRDLLRGKTRYGELAASSERIPTNILADRLKKLERYGLITSTLYSEHPPRREYHLTVAGWELRRVLEAMARWGLEQFPGTNRNAIYTVPRPDDPSQPPGEPARETGPTQPAH